MALRYRFVAAVTACIVVCCRDGRAPLNDAIRDAGRRPIRGRLSDLAWAPAPPTTRGDDARKEQIRLRAVAAEVWHSSSDEQTRAAAALIAGDSRDATQMLQNVTSRDAASAGAWNDLATAMLENADGDIQILCRALAAADRALEIDPRRPEALFNRALIVESLSLRDAAVKAYVDYLRVDGGSAWAAEARQRLQSLQGTRSRASSWQELMPALERAAAAADMSPIRRAALAFPQDARVWTETEILGMWGDRLMAADTTSSIPLAIARAVGNALRDAGGDELSNDAVAVIDDAAKRDHSRLKQLAQAHVAYRNGRVSYRNRDVAVAIPQLREALRLFSAAGSPMVFMARYYLANASIDSGDRAAAGVMAHELARDAPLRYRALRAEIDWLDAIVSGFGGSYERALQSFQRAAAAFDALREQQFATEMRDRIAALLTILGRTSDAWRLRRTSFPAAGEAGNPRRLEATLLSAITDALHEKEWDVAHSLLALMANLEGGNVRLHAEALVWRALAAEKASMHRTAEADLQAARNAANLLRDAAMREDVQNELRLVEAMLIRDTDPERSVALLTEHLASARRRGRTTRLSQVLIERARGLRVLGRTSEAEADLRSAIELVETRRALLGREELRDSFLGTSSTPYDELADMLDWRGDTLGAIATADQRRARVLSDRMASAAAEPMPRLPAGSAVITYGVFEERFVVYVIGRRGLERFSVAKTRTAIERSSADFVAVLSSGGAREVRAKGAALYGDLIAPAATALAGIDSLIVVADGPLQRIPFAALVADDGTFLVEHYAIRIAPCVRRCWSPAPPQASAASAALVVGNPLIDAERFPGLASLDSAEREARDISAMYRAPVTLIASGATKERVVQNLPNAEVAHIAAHAVVDRLDPGRSRLLFTRGARDDGTLSTSEVAAMRLERVRCVVLAACRTAVSAGGYGDLRTLAFAFLAAGCRNVVATLWNVDDAATRELSIGLHRALRTGMTPMQAARDAQLCMIHSGNPRLASPSAWASIQVYGCE